MQHKVIQPHIHMIQSSVRVPLKLPIIIVHNMYVHLHHSRLLIQNPSNALNELVERGAMRLTAVGEYT